MARPSRRRLDEVDSNDVEVCSESSSGHADAQILDSVRVGSDVESHLGEGMLLKNPKSSVKSEDIELWRGLYRILLGGDLGANYS